MPSGNYAADYVAQDIEFHIAFNKKHFQTPCFIYARHSMSQLMFCERLAAYCRFVPKRNSFHFLFTVVFGVKRLTLVETNSF